MSRPILTVNRALERTLLDLGRAHSPELKGAARVLRRSLKKTLGVRGRGKPSAPGEPPRKQTGGLEKSVISGAFGAGQRVAVTQFYAPLQESGVDTQADAAAPRSRRNLFTGEARQVLAESSKALFRKVRRRAGGSRKTRHLKIEPRPFMQRSLAAAEHEMVDVMVTTISRRLPA